MPHAPEDGRYPHLELVREDPNPNRRKQSPPPQSRPDAIRRGQFGPRIRTRIEEIEEEAQARPVPPAGIQPHLVFRVPLLPNSSLGFADRLQQIGASLVGIDPDGAVIAFWQEANLTNLLNGAEEYTSGPRINTDTGEPYKSTVWDVLDFIDVDRMHLWGRSDRVGRMLATVIGAEGQNIDLQRLYVVDLELWHRGSMSLVRESLEELHRLIQNDPMPDERIRDEFVGDALCLAKVSVQGTKLSQLLSLDVIAEVELPPAVVFDVTMANRSTSRQFPTPPRPPENGARVCVIDSGIVPQHPLLANNVGSYESILTTTSSGVDEHGHGTMVAGVAVFGDVRAGYETGQFESEVMVFSARVLNDQNEFDDEELIVRQMERSIETFKAEPYRCRVFNLSLGSRGPWFRDNLRQSIWAECLDQLARKHKVILVLSAGNHAMGTGDRTRLAEETVVEYPHYFFNDECGLCEPSTAAIAVTVGGVSQYDAPSVASPARIDSISRPVALSGQPCPITRVGPGISNAIKPEFVAPAGNGLFTGDGFRRTIVTDEGLAVMSFAHDWTIGGSLFRFENGTSFAAPRVARIAALVWQRLRDTLGDNVDPNTVRAVLATSASPPQPTIDLIQPLHGEAGVRRVCGYGQIDEDFALNTGDRRVTFVAQGQIPIDTIQIFALPIPDEFREASGRKRVVVGLAFDPPVRSRRSEYLGVDMNIALIRGMTVEEIIESYRALTTTESAALKAARKLAREENREYVSEVPGTPQDRRRCQLTPGSTALQGSTLHRTEWSFQRSDVEYGDTYYLVVRAERNWAPETITHQDFGLAVSLDTQTEVRLRGAIMQRIRPRVRV